MLRNQAKKQSSFYVCASCRGQHNYDLAQLRSTRRIRTTSLPSTPRPFSSNSATIAMRPAVQGQRNAVISQAVLSGTTRGDAKGYATWGKFGSPSLPGQSNAAWGNSSNSVRPAGATSPSTSTWGGASKIPPATGTSASGGAVRIPSYPMTPAWVGGPSGTPPAIGRSAWEGGASQIPPATRTPPWEVAGRIPPVPSAPSPSTSKQTTSSTRPTSIPSQSSTTQSPQEPRVDAQRGDPRRSTIPIHRTSGGQSRETNQNEGVASSSLLTTSSSTASPSRPNISVPKASTQQAPPFAPAPNSGSSASASASIGTTPRPPPNSRWGNIAPSVFSSPSGGPSGAVPRNPAFGAPALESQLGAVSGNFTSGASPGTTPTNSAPGGSAGWTPGKAIFGGSSGWTPQKATPAPSSNPAKGANNDSKISLAKSASGLDTATWAKSSKIDPSHALEKSAEKMSRDAASQPSSKKQTLEPILDTTFMRPPIRKPPPGAEFPQLQRRSSKDDIFEAMSPFKLPSKQDWAKNNIAPPGSASNAIAPDSSERNSSRHHRRDDQLPRKVRQTDWRAATKSESPIRVRKTFSRTQESQGSDSSKLSKPGDHFELMSKTAITEEKKINTFDHDDWGEGPTTSESIQSITSPSTEEATSLFDGERRGDSNKEIDSRGRGKGSGRETRDYRGRARDLDNFPDSDNHASRDKANKRRKFGGDRRQNMNEDEEIDDYDSYREARARRKQRQRRLEEDRAAEEAAAPKTIRLPEYITVYDLAEALRIKPANFLRDLEQLGFENTLHDSVMTGETAALVAAEYGFEPTVESGADVDLRPLPPPEDPSSVPPRPPIVTIMGHVDHGKTTILDTLRKSSIVAQEFGGITQHIGAFSVKLSMGKIITFLDTPGHAAFLNMRQRGANVTDIVVLVVAVDDSVKPQTIEAIKHAQSAKVPMIVAINKIDIDNNPNRIDMVKQDLANYGVELEDYGGDVQVVSISGKTGLGIRDLEDAILTLSEVLDMRAETDGMAEGWVLEASIKPDGRAATILVKRGSLRIGDLIVAGTAYTRVRIMRNEAGVDVDEAGPGTPIEIYGSWKGEPMAGDMVLQAPDEAKAQAAVEYRQEIADRAIAAAQNAEREAQGREKAEREALKKKMEEAEAAGEHTEDAEPIEVGPKLVSIIVKGDVMGSVEAVSLAIQEIGNNEVRPRILRASPGQITESDVDHMATANGALVNFNSTIPAHVLQRANKAGVVILDHNIIYETVQAVKDLLSAQLEPIHIQRVLAEAQVQQIFPINITKRKFKNIAGVKVTNGKVTRGGQYRVMRDGEVVYKGKLEALKQSKDDVTEVKRGIECGMMFDDYDDFHEGDLIQLYEDVEQPRYL